MMQLDRLPELAQEKDPEHRRELLRCISNLFEQNAAGCRTPELVLFNDVMARLLDQVDVEGRADLANSLAWQPLAPHEVVMKLATDQPEVANIVLENSSVLTDEDLVKVAATQSEGHMEAIARRKTVAEMVTDALIKRGSPTVLNLILENSGASFSAAGFNAIAGHAKDDFGMQLRLVARDDVPHEIMDEIVPIISRELHSRIEENGYDPAATMPDAFAAKLRARLAQILKQQQEEARQISDLIEQINSGKAKINDVVNMLGRANRLIDLIKLFETFVGVSAQDGMAALIGESDDPLMIIMRALNVDEVALISVMELRNRRRRTKCRPNEEILRRYKALTTEFAQRSLRFHKVRAAIAG